MRFAIDSNIFIYSFIRDDPERHAAAIDLIRRSIDADCILPIQVLGEFLNVIRRKQPQLFAEACAQAKRWSLVMPVFETSATDLVAGGQLAEKHRIQFWDSVLCEVARSGGAEVLLTEDLQDGRDFDGLRVANPFYASNRLLLAELLVPAGD